MSQMIGMPPRQIQLPGPGGPGGPPGGPGGPPPGAGGPAGGVADMGKVKAGLQQALQGLDVAMQAEGDDADRAQIAQLAAKVHQLIAGPQQLQDQAMGAGPGVKLVRKASGGGA